MRKELKLWVEPNLKDMISVMPAHLSLPSALGMRMALVRASKGYHPRNRRSQQLDPAMQPGKEGHAPKCSHSNLYVTAASASDSRAGERDDCFPSYLLPVPNTPPIIQPVAAAAAFS